MLGPKRTFDFICEYTPRQWQQQCHDDMKRFTVLALHRRAGKTELAIMELIHEAFNFKLDLGHFFYVAPFLKQAKVIAWARLKQRIAALEQAGAVIVNESELTVTFTHNGAIIRIFGADNPDAMRGVRLDGAVIDEVAQIKPEVWNDILQPALSDRKGWALFIGTPNGVNLFSELFYKAQRLEDWNSALFTVDMTQSIDPDEVNRLRRDMSETSFAREYLCDFSAAGDDQLISLAEVHDAVNRKYKADDLLHSPRVMGVDPARFGDDRSVIMYRQGLQAFDPWVGRGIDNMALADKVASEIQRWKPDAVFIDAGAGAGVIDRLHQLGFEVIEVHFGGRASDSLYFNKRAEMWHAGIRQWLKDGGALPDVLALKQDLGAPTFWYDQQGRVCLEQKDDIKKRGLPSPDLGDALALTFAFQVAKRKYVIPSAHGEDITFDTGVRQSVKKDYDPYENI